MLCASLAIDFPGLAKPHTCRFESGLVDLAIALDDADWMSGAVGKRGDLPGALVPAYHCGAMVEHLTKVDGLVGGHGKDIGKCLVVKCFESFLENG